MGSLNEVLGSASISVPPDVMLKARELSDANAAFVLNEVIINGAHASFMVYEKYSDTAFMTIVDGSFSIADLPNDKTYVYDNDGDLLFEDSLSRSLKTVTIESLKVNYWPIVRTGDSSKQEVGIDPGTGAEVISFYKGKKVLNGVQVEGVVVMNSGKGTKDIFSGEELESLGYSGNEPVKVSYYYGPDKMPIEGLGIVDYVVIKGKYSIDIGGVLTEFTWIDQFSADRVLPKSIGAVNGEERFKIKFGGESFSVKSIDGNDITYLVSRVDGHYKADRIVSESYGFSYDNVPSAMAGWTQALDRISASMPAEIDPSTLKWVRINMVDAAGIVQSTSYQAFASNDLPVIKINQDGLADIAFEKDSRIVSYRYDLNDSSSGVTALSVFLSDENTLVVDFYKQICTSSRGILPTKIPDCQMAYQGAGRNVRPKGSILTGQRFRDNIISGGM
jgi:hypothetical protein